MGKDELFLDAVLKGQIDKVKEILEKSPTLITAKDDEGWTALHLASGNSRELIELLVRKGADPMARNNDGETPAVLASGKGYPENAILIHQLAGEPVSERLVKAAQDKALRDKKVHGAITRAKEKKKQHFSGPNP